MNGYAKKTAPAQPTKTSRSVVSSFQLIVVVCDFGGLGVETMASSEIANHLPIFRALDR
jgi:hypothetical protein